MAGRRLAGAHVSQEEHPMTKLSKTLGAVTAFAAIATFAGRVVRAAISS
jgi:hypothetical protein